jgi:hypothetical protein
VSGEILSASVFLPRRNPVITADVEEAFWGLSGAGFAPDHAGSLRIVNERRTPMVSGEMKDARVFQGAMDIEQAIRLLRRVPADYWGQVMLRGQFSLGGQFEDVTAIVCPFSSEDPGVFSAHLMFRKAGLLLEDRPAPQRAVHALEALDRLQDSTAPILAFLDVNPPNIEGADLRHARFPWLPWAGYASPGAAGRMGGGAFLKLAEWIPWLEKQLHAPGTGAARQTRGGGYLWALPSPLLGRRPPEGAASGPLQLWYNYLENMIASRMRVFD